MMPSPITQPQFPKQLRQKYIIENVIGEGAYGCVWKGENKITKKPVAIKGFFEIFKDHIDAKRILREVSILRQFPNNEHVIKLIDVICPDNIFEFEEFYIVLEFCSYDLKTFIKHHEKNEEMLSLPVIRSILFQLLCSLKFCKDQHIIHRDIKPANILIYESMDNPYIKLCDFGLAKDFHNSFQETHEKMNIEIPNSIENKYPVRIISSKPPLYQEHKQIIPKKVKIISTNQDKSKIAYFSNKFSFENRDAHHNHLPTIPLNRSLPLDSKNFQRKKSSKSLTKHLVTRWYRPPEIILLQEYDFKADIWSVGCVFAELLGKIFVL